MYYIIRILKDEYLFEYSLEEGQAGVTSMDIEAMQFTSKTKADWIADRFGGEVLEIS